MVNKFAFLCLHSSTCSDLVMRQREDLAEEIEALAESNKIWSGSGVEETKLRWLVAWMRAFWADLTSGWTNGLLVASFPSSTNLFEAFAADERISDVDDRRIEMQEGDEGSAQRSLKLDRLLEIRDW